LIINSALQRILCFELVARANANWYVYRLLSLDSFSRLYRVLRYVPGAVAETDVPDSLPECTMFGHLPYFRMLTILVIDDSHFATSALAERLFLRRALLPVARQAHSHGGS